MKFIEYINNSLQKSSERSKKAFWNVVISIFAKGIAIICSLLIVPLTIDYVNATQYGVWLTLSSIIAWIAFFDLGLGNGFRNRFAEAKAKNDIPLAQKYLSTTYFILSIISIAVFLLIIVINKNISWSRVLNIDISYSEELQSVFAIVSLFFCINLVANIFNILLSADQKPGLASLITGLGSVISLIIIYVLTKSSSGSLVKLALYFSGIPTITLIIVSFFAFQFTSYKLYKPSFRSVDLKLVPDILNLGIKFFTIYLCMILVFQLINIVVSRELGPLAVTQYNLVYKYFNAFYSLWIIVLSPVWSAFTDAYHKNDIAWMKATIRRYEIFWCVYMVLSAIMLAVSPFFYEIWIKGKVQLPISLSFYTMLFFNIQAISGLYMQAINGIGAVRIQFIIYFLFAVFSWPLLTVSCRLFGINGALIIPTLVYAVQAIACKFQLSQILNNKARGIFLK